MKTPMQELYEKMFNEMQPNHPVGYNVVFGIAADMVKDMLEKEKEVMESSWNNGHQVGRFEGAKIAEEGFSSFEFYFNETFNTKEK